jgi:hypothetical protein
MEGDLNMGGNDIYSAGTVTTNTISATTYQNLPIDPNTYVTGFTYGSNVFTIKQNNGQPDLTATIGSVTGWTVNGNLTVTGTTSVQGLTATTISATTYQNLPIDPDTYVTGFTYNNNVFTLKQNNGQSDLTAIINSVTGWTVNGDLTVTGTTSVQGLTATTVSATTISANTVVISGTTVNPKQTIALFFGHDSLSPSDTQTYYIGNAINLTAIISGSDGRRVIMPKTGQIVAMDICLNIGGVNGSSESSTFTINNVTQSTQSTITSSYVYTASSANIFYTLSSSLSVTAGDKIEIRWTTPAWVTNPTSVRQQMNVYLQY